MFDGIYTKARLDKAQILRDNGLNPYRNDAIKSISNANFIAKFSHLKTAEVKKDDEIFHVAGRVKLLRMMGKACFFTIEDGSLSDSNLQIYASQNDLGTLFELLKKCLEVGDFVNISGYAFVTKTNELSLHAKDFKILTKAISPLPEKFHGLTDIELRYRARYLDLIMNSEVKQVFFTRTKIISLVRRFFEDKGFLEVETPMLHPIPGGANAKPFITHHNALDVARYLRIAPELYLKRLIVGGFEAVFEINRNFRNEGMDHSHNPEFSMLEFYWAYKNYKDLIELTKELFVFLLQELKLDRVQKYGDLTIDFLDFHVMTYKESIAKFSKMQKDVLENKEALLAQLSKDGAKISEDHSYGKLLEAAFEHYVEEYLINPTFITEYPIDISPLARRSDVDAQIADRFEFFIAGREIANGFSELNDPLDQYERFKAQVALKDAGDDEAQFMDEDYVNALSYGMPPTAGQGIGIDRLVMLLTGAKSIKDVILFPAMK
ncbi:MAG: lysine--tRNA ligase [Helicobacter sp.]|nr:lysine--tRNA ligase [Helicobacter sp.]